MSSSHQDWDPSVLDQGSKDDEKWGGIPDLESSFDEFGNYDCEDDKQWGEVLIPDFNKDVQWGEVPTLDSSFNKVPDDRSLHVRISGGESHIYNETPDNRSHIDQSKHANTPNVMPTDKSKYAAMPTVAGITLMGSNHNLLQNLFRKNPLPFSTFFASKLLII
jgi:hypothetical protein